MNNIVPNSTFHLARGIFGEILLPPIVDLDEAETPVSRLARILGGDWINETERGIYQTLGEKGEPFSMVSAWFLPTGASQQPYQTFVPVLTKVDSLRWKLGILGYGRLKTFEEPNPEKALMRAQEVIDEWRQAETNLDR